MAKLYFRYGAMGSSKTANAIMVQYNYEERGQKVLMLKPKLENRDGAVIVRSRCGLETACRFIEDVTAAGLWLRHHRRSAVPDQGAGRNAGGDGR